MIYTTKIQSAITFATTVHESPVQQKRKGKDVPYITHPLTVGLILSQTGADEAVVIAGILHDTIEDCVPYGSVTKEVLVDKYGPEVADLVDSVTEQNKNLPWPERKAFALEHIKQFSNQSLLLKSADVIANGTELVNDFKVDGNATFKRFNASQEHILEGQLSVIDLIKNRWSANPLLADLEELAIQLKRIQALGAGDLAYAEWSVLFIEYEMNRAYADSALRDDVLQTCSDFHAILQRYNEGNDIDEFNNNLFKIKESFHQLIKRAESNEKEHLVHLLLITHVGDMLASILKMLPSQKA